MIKNFTFSLLILNCIFSPLFAMHQDEDGMSGEEKNTLRRQLNSLCVCASFLKKEGDEKSLDKKAYYKGFEWFSEQYKLKTHKALPLSLEEFNIRLDYITKYMRDWPYLDRLINYYGNDKKITDGPITEDKNLRDSLYVYHLLSGMDPFHPDYDEDKNVDQTLASPQHLRREQVPSSQKS